MRAVISIVTVLFLVQFDLFAQGEQGKVVTGGGGYVSIGTNFISTQSLDRSLGQYQLPMFGSGQRFFTFGGGGGSFINRFYFGGYGEGHVGLSASNDLYKSKMSGGHGLVHIGYALSQSESFVFYPTIGIGGGGTTMRIDEGPSYDESVSGLLLAPDTKLSTGYMLLKLGLNADFPINPDPTNHGGLLLGVSAGYQLVPFSSRWKDGGDTVPELAKFDPSGFYLRLKVGWARYYSR